QGYALHPRYPRHRLRPPVSTPPSNGTGRRPNGTGDNGTERQPARIRVDAHSVHADAGRCAWNGRVPREISADLPVGGSPSGGGRSQVPVPQWVGLLRVRQQPPVRSVRGTRNDPQRPPDLRQELVGLAVVALRAAGDAVLPGMLAAPTAGKHVVDRLGTPSAVGAPEPVTVHQPGSRQRNL